MLEKMSFLPFLAFLPHAGFSLVSLVRFASLTSEVTNHEGEGDIKYYLHPEVSTGESVYYWSIISNSSSYRATSDLSSYSAIKNIVCVALSKSPVVLAHVGSSAFTVALLPVSLTLILVPRFTFLDILSPPVRGIISHCGEVA